MLFRSGFITAPVFTLAFRWLILKLQSLKHLLILCILNYISITPLHFITGNLKFYFVFSHYFILFYIIWAFLPRMGQINISTLKIYLALLNIYPLVAEFSLEMLSRPVNQSGCRNTWVDNPINHRGNFFCIYLARFTSCEVSPSIIMFVIGRVRQSLTHADINTHKYHLPMTLETIISWSVCPMWFTHRSAFNLLVLFCS